MDLFKKFVKRIDDDFGYDNEKLARDLQKIAEEHQALQLQQTGVISRSYTQKEVRELFIKLETERSKYYVEDANDIVPLEEFLSENGL